MAPVTQGYLILEFIGSGPDTLVNLRALTILPLQFLPYPGSPAANAGVTPIYGYTGYNAASGYGFSSNSVSLNSVPGSAFAADMTFLVDLPDGFYDVTPTIGGGLTNLQVILQGSPNHTDQVSTPQNQTFSQTYLVDVTDGQLSLRLLPSTGQTIYLYSLTIVPRAFPLTFQFGPAGSAVAPGSDAISNYTIYDAQSHYGFSASTQMNSQSGEVYASDMTFREDLPNGTYVVTATLAGTGNSADMVTITFDGLSEGSFATGTGPVVESFVAVIQNGGITIEFAGGNGTHVNFAAITGLTIKPKAVADDFDGDGKADLTVYGQIAGTSLYGFTTLTSSSDYTQSIVWDNSGAGFGNDYSIPVIGDYFGEGKPAYAIWYPLNNGLMQFLAVSSVNPSEVINVTMGLSTDLPVVGDVDGDGKADFGVFGYYPGLGYRYDFLLSSRNFDVSQRFIYSNTPYGYGTSTSSPVVGDFDGTGRDGLGYYQPSNGGGTFIFVNFSFPRGSGFVTTATPTDFFEVNYSGPPAIPIAVNYDGDGISDLAFFGANSGGYYGFTILTSSTHFNQSRSIYFDYNGNGFGYSASIPTMADYEGDGIDDFSVYQPDGSGNAYFYLNDGTGQVLGSILGGAADLPVNAPAWMLAEKVRAQ